MDYVLGELASRSINFFISKSSKAKVLDVEDSLQRVLIQAQVMDEATGRHITNQAMLQQLDMLRDAMYHGCYILDTFSRNTQILEQLQDALDNLSSMILDVKELVVFLTSYPRLYRQPYSMHLLLSNCMFGRQMEAELVLNFLLQARPHDAEELEVLPIVGPGRVGKSTLVARVCKDERVRDQFSEILFLSDHDFRDEKLTNLWEGYAKKFQNCTAKKDVRVLVVVEVAGDFHEGDWKRLYSASKQCLTNGSKIIITSRSKKITTVGTRSALMLKYLSDEAYWYFFKTLAFGSMDPMMHPRMAYLAMEIARMFQRSLITGIVTACVMRDNFDTYFWCKLLAFLRGSVKWHVSKFGEHPSHCLNQNRPAHLGRMIRTSEAITVYGWYECSSQVEVPEITLQNLMYGSAKPSGRFEILAWSSPIPPYHSYIYNCEIEDLKTTSVKRKRS
ncbi:unnamed protein product [Urochloa decumbens]|uniref:NB-ARC domain-containing protein n=1 Tax=Urochloa decumbens TaxID=240449 RepID=A0ABC9FMK0_9POAL